ncbi:hypothetical protein G3R49_00370 [Shewanella sp. WXL01]|uniref:LemA family protein n=1 Tax=Shewanella maritima TaxID=2520507 RepID=A0A411PGX5_9GAMM|nr:MULTISPECIES: hypothetical protein [Shewanella]NKF49029.1 hypothetical protein [Shewanella sp. WXL01]QBF82827.1 hypothetical protein EXU30_09080 [Shewanella maritima]
MLAIILCLGLALISGCLWYAGLNKRRSSAIKALKTIQQKIDLRLALLQAFSKETQASWSANVRNKFHKLKLLEAESAWDQKLDTDLATMLKVWQRLDKELNEFFVLIGETSFSAKKKQQQNQLAQDIETVQSFYNQTVTELNSGVNLLPGAVITRVTNLSPLPTFATPAIN